MQCILQISNVIYCNSETLNFRIFLSRWLRYWQLHSQLVESTIHIFHARSLSVTCRSLECLFNLLCALLPLGQDRGRRWRRFYHIDVLCVWHEMILGGIDLMQVWHLMIEMMLRNWWVHAGVARMIVVGWRCLWCRRWMMSCRKLHRQHVHRVVDGCVELENCTRLTRWVVVVSIEMLHWSYTQIRGLKFTFFFHRLSKAINVTLFDYSTRWKLNEMCCDEMCCDKKKLRWDISHRNTWLILRSLSFAQVLFLFYSSLFSLLLRLHWSWSLSNGNDMDNHIQEKLLPLWWR